MVVVLSFLGRNLKPVNSTWLALHHLVITFRKVGREFDSRPGLTKIL